MTTLITDFPPASLLKPGDMGENRAAKAQGMQST